MPRIVSIRPLSSIRAGPGSTIEPDGTIRNPEPYEAADVRFDDGLVVQVERPLTLSSLQTAWRAARQAQQVTIDGISPGTDIPP